MTIQSDIVTALSSVAGGRIFPQIADENAAYPLVNYRVSNKEPITTIDGITHATKYTVIFECWGKSYQSALDTAASVRSAIQASSLNFYTIDEPDDDYDVQTDSYLERVFFGFLHQ
jgi:hypothetical protein